MDQDTEDRKTTFTTDAHFMRASAEDAIVRVGPDSSSRGLMQRLLHGPLQRIARVPIDVSWPNQKALPGTTPKKRVSAYLVSFLGFVVLPSFVTILYLAFIASDQYDSEARFAIHAAQVDFNAPSADGKSAGVSQSSSGMPSLATQEGYIVTGYIHSHAIINDLSKEMDVRAIFRRPEADFWAALKKNASIEDLVQYWNGMVTTSIDGPSGIVTVDTRAFRPDDALRLSQAIVRLSEKLVNDISLRSRTDLMQHSEDEVRRAEGLVRQALADMRAYRDKEGFINPVDTATQTGKLLLQAMSDRMKLQNDYYASAASLSPNAPSLQSLKAKLEGLDKQIEDLKGQLTTNSPRGKAISASLGRFEELEMQRLLAEKLLTMSEDALERARLRAERQSMYIETFVQPGLPEDAKYPERLAFSCLIPMGLVIVWGIFALLAAAVNDHKY